MKDVYTQALQIFDAADYNIIMGGNRSQTEIAKFIKIIDENLIGNINENITKLKNNEYQTVFDDYHEVLSKQVVLLSKDQFIIDESLIPSQMNISDKNNLIYIAENVYKYYITLHDVFDKLFIQLFDLIHSLISLSDEMLIDFKYNIQECDPNKPNNADLNSYRKTGSNIINLSTTAGVFIRNDYPDPMEKDSATINECNQNMFNISLNYDLLYALNDVTINDNTSTDITINDETLTDITFDNTSTDISSNDDNSFDKTSNDNNSSSKTYMEIYIENINHLIKNNDIQFDEIIARLHVIKKHIRKMIYILTKTILDEELINDIFNSETYNKTSDELISIKIPKEIDENNHVDPSSMFNCLKFKYNDSENVINKCIELIDKNIFTTFKEYINIRKIMHKYRVFNTIVVNLSVGFERIYKRIRAIDVVSKFIHNRCAFDGNTSLNKMKECKVCRIKF